MQDREIGGKYVNRCMGKCIGSGREKNYEKYRILILGAVMWVISRSIFGVVGGKRDYVSLRYIHVGIYIHLCA